MNTKPVSINLLSCLILVSVVFLAGCSAFAGAPVVLAQSDTVEEFPVTGSDIVQQLGSDETTFSISYPAAEAELIEDDTSRTWEIDTDDIAAARVAAKTLSQNFEMVSGELDASDISAAREAALILSQIYTAVEVDFVEEDFLRSWEIGADDMAAARQAAHYLAEVERVSHEISAADISAARQAAFALSQTNVVGEVDFDAAEMVSGELDASDISAAREAALIQVAQYLAEVERGSHEISAADISAARQAAQYLAEVERVSHEISAADISAARQAAVALSHISVAGGVDHKNPAFQRTAAELELARRFGASEEQLAILISAE